jgi:hypothetical protein
MSAPLAANPESLAALLWLFVGVMPTVVMATIAWFLQGRFPTQAPLQILVPVLYILVAVEWVAAFVVEASWRRRVDAMNSLGPGPDEPAKPALPEGAGPLLVTLTATLAATGNSIAIYGLVLVFLGMPFRAVLPFFALAAAHLIVFRIRSLRLVEGLKAGAAGLPPSID